MNKTIDNAIKGEHWLSPDIPLNLEIFLTLTRRSQELIFGCINSNNKKALYHLSTLNGFINYYQTLGMFNGSPKSPIEEIYHIADIIYNYEIRGAKNTSNIGFPYLQYEINVNDKKYIADFYYSGKKHGSERGNYKVVVECDGHDFHERTKQQVKYDNERELELLTAGYDVVRFSGHQIYENPIMCVYKVHEFINSKYLS